MNKIKQAFLHLRDNRGDEHTARMIWVAIAFLTGAILFSVVFASISGPMYNWFDNLNEDLYVDGSDGEYEPGTPGGDYGGSGGGTPDAPVAPPDVDIISSPGLYDHSGMLIYTWDELIARGYLSVFEDILTPGTNVMPAGKLVCKDVIKTVGLYAFANQTNLTSIIFGDSVVYISDNAFSGLSTLSSVRLPASLAYIGTDAFSNCTNLSNITYGGTQEQWRAMTREAGWNTGMPYYVVHCIDGSIYPIILQLIENATITPNYPTDVGHGEQAELFFTAMNDYSLPATITVLGAEYTWDLVSGKLTITNPSDFVYVYISGEKTGCRVVFDANTGTVDPTFKRVVYNLPYGTLPTPVKTGYNFVGWFTAKTGGSEVTAASLVSERNDHTVYAHWTPKTDTPYTVHHYYMNLDGSYPSTGEVQSLKGTTDATVTPAVVGKTGFTSPTTQTVTIKPDGSTVVKYYYTRNQYTVSLNKGTGITGVSGAGTYYYGETVTINATVKTGYTWKNWNGTVTNNTQKYVFAMPANNLNLTANATARTDITYTVYHYYMGLDGKYPATGEAMTYTGTTDTQVTAPLRGKTGFTSPSEQKVTINGDGSTVVHYKYERQKFTLTLDKTAGITSVTGGGTYYYGASVTVERSVAPGYTWTKWTGSAASQSFDSTAATYTFTMPAANLTLKANATANTNTTYKVNHYYMGLDGKYGTPTTQTFTGTTDTSVTPAVVGQTGFTSPATQTVKIDGNGTTVVNYYYTRNQYTVTLTKGTGISAVTGAAKYYYGATVTINATVIDGYKWTNWTGTFTQTTQKYSFAMPANDVALTANATIRNDVPYTVYHYYMNLDGTYPTTGEAQNYTGTTNASVTPPLLGKTGFTSPATQTVTIRGDGSTVVKYYYSRNQYTVTVNKGTGIASVTGGGTYYYGASVTINATLITGYKWNKWTGTHETTTQKYTFTMPANNVTDTANATARTDITYTVNHYYMGLDGQYSTPEVQTLKGTTDTNVTPAVVGKTGFTSPTTQTVKVKGDGSTVVNYYYSRNQYTVTVTAGTGIQSVSGGGTYYYGASVTINAVVKNGYTWSKWSGTHSTTTQKYTFTMPANNVNDTANATANTYTVVYNGNGNTGGSTANSTHVYDTAKALTANGYTKTGYTFIGWATTDARADAGTVDYADKASVKNLTATANGTVTLYAVWKANTYTVTYNGNGNTGGSTANSVHTYDVAKALTTNGFTKTGYTFIGWATTDARADAGTVDYADKASVKNLTATAGGTVTLYAVWKANTYSNYIAHWMWGFVNSEGNNSSKDAFHIGNVPFNGTYGQSFVLDTDWAAEIPNGFYLNSVFGTNAVTGSWKTYAMGTAITQLNNGMGFEFDYYPYTYTITYNLDGGTNNAANPNSYNVLYGVTLANPTKAGYTFDGWYIGNTKVTGINAGANATFSSVDDMYAKLASRTTGNITLTAKWKVNQYTLVIDKNDGSAVTTVTQNYGSTYTVPTPTRNGYTFAGWTLSGSGSVSGSVYTFGAGNGSLKANWTPNTITITLNPAPGSGGTTKVYYKYGINKYYSDYACTQQITAITRPTRAGYTFVNYHGDGTSGGLNGERYIAYDSVEFASDLCTDIYKDATFSATWSANTYTLNYITPVAGTPSTNISGIVPNGYTILEYITSSGTQWIDSGVSIAGNTWVDVDLMWTSAFDYNMMFGAWSDVSASLRAANTVCAAGGGGATQNVGSTTAVNVKYNIKIGADKGYTQNGTKYSLGSTTNAASGRHILLFAASDGSTGNNPYAWSSYGVGRIYGMRIYNGSTLVRNFIPCKNASGTIGMYDLVEGKFYTNKGTGTFTAGPTIGSSTTITYTPETSLTINAAPSTTGYTFGGWKVQSSTDGSWTNGATFSGSQSLGTGKYGNAVLVAQWTINSYTLTVNPNGGSWNGSTSSQTATQNYKTTKSIPNPTRTGYTFTGWSLSGGGSLSGTTYTYGAGNATLTANWTPNVYTVTLNNQSASVAGTTAYYYQFNTTKTISGVTCYYYTDAACTNPLTSGYYITVPKKAGYIFGGYYTGTNGSGTQYVDSTGQCVNNIFQSVAGNTTLYAKWTASTYTYAYNANGGSGSIANQTPAWNTSFTLSSGFSRTGWTFNGYYVQRSTDGRWVSNGGWATDAEMAANGWTKSYYQPGELHAINSSWVDPYIGSATFTFYAQWTAIPYTLDINGLWDGVVQGGLADRGTFDIYINGTLVGNDVTDYYNPSMTYGDTYQVTDVKRQSAAYQRYAAQDIGAQSGSITGDTNVMLSFVPAYYTITSKATYDSTWHTSSDTGNMEFTYIGINGTEMPDASRVTFANSNPTDIWTYPYGTEIAVAVADKYDNDGGAHSYITWNGSMVAGKASYSQYVFGLSSDVVINMEYNAWLTGVHWNLDEVRVAYWNCYITSTERDYYVP